jgi:hypothetical protein
MDLCIVSHDGAIVLPRTMQAAPEPFLTAVAPSRDAPVVAVECRFTWDWLADLWADEGMPWVLGPALSRKAIHGGSATNDTMDAHQLATLHRGNLRPQAAGSPAQRRATPDLRRRRTPLRRTRAAR